MNRKLNVRAFALTCGLIWGLGLLVLTWWIMIFEGATGETTLIGYIYRGYEISPVGSLIGLVWAFFDGLAGGAVFAWLYNFLIRDVATRARSRYESVGVAGSESSG
jgi:hypothetical protein